MARKKKKSVRDARGYQQGATQSQKTVPTPIPRAAKSKKALPAPTPKQGDISITLSVHERLESLLITLRSQEKEQRPSIEPEEASDRFEKRVSTLLDRLTALGFQFSDIQQAVAFLGYAASYETALDWLCVHLTTAELPALFTEGKVRDGVVAETTSAAELTVLLAPKSSFAGSERNDRDSVYHEEFVRKMQDATIRLDGQKASTEDTENEEAKAAQKAWLLQQYEYEEEEEKEEDGEDDNETHQNILAANDLEDEAVLDKKEEKPQPREESVFLPEELLLKDLREELNQLECDLNDEAGNYMRSKHEIKEMQKKGKNLRKRVNGMEAKVAKLKAKQRQDAVSEDQADVVAGKGEEAGVPASLFHDGEESDKEENELPLLDIFSTPSPAPNTSTQKASLNENEVECTTNSTVIQVPKDSIPKSWTGKTPKVILEEWCRKEKLPKPIFRKRGLRDCTLLLKLNKSGRNNLEIEQDAGAYVDAQNFAAIRAMYRLNPDLPLYRILPPFHRETWLRWVRDAQQKRDDETQVVDAERQAKVDQLLKSISASADVRKTEEKSCRANIQGYEDEKLSEQIQESWDDENSTSDSVPRVNTRTPLEKTSSEDSRLQKFFHERQESSKYQEMLETRKSLPVFSFQSQLLETIRQEPVTIVSAETGAGKSTQVPQFILSEALEQGRGNSTSIICTQPRRVAATSLAARVSEEMAEGSIGGLVGYQIRLESKRSTATKLLFCTTGVVLRRLIENPTLEGVSHVIVDEVHEMQWQIDLLLASLRSLLRGRRPDLKIILMSATLNAELFSSYFGGAPLVTVPGRTFPVNHYYLEDILEHTGHIVEEGSRCARREYGDRESVSLWVTTRGGEKRKETAALQSQTDITVSGEFPDYSMATQRSMDRVDETVINYDLIEDAITVACRDQSVFCPPGSSQGHDGAILIFLPGLGEIRTLTERLLASRSFGNQRLFEVVPLHSTLSSNEQQRAFRKPRKGCRKIIVSTNIAETSVTIPDVTCVIDSGLVREMQRDKRTGTRKLVSTWCSRANVKQRSGRAGRVQPGVCLKLFSSRTEKTMKKAAEPELRRIPLEEVCLTVLASGLAKSCKQFLSETPEPPMDSAVDFALEELRCIGAIQLKPVDDTDTVISSVECLTELGRHLTKLPIDARLGKMLIFGGIFKCLGSALTIAASLSASQSPFATSVTESSLARAAHGSFADPRSDFLRLLNVWDAYSVAVSTGSGRRFCREKYLNYTALREIGEARRQFLDLLCDIGLVSRAALGNGASSRAQRETLLSSSRYCENDKKDTVIHCIVCAGLYPNIAKLTNETIGAGRGLVHKTERLSVHSQSVNSKLGAYTSTPSLWLAYHEKLGTGNRVSISTTCFVHPFSLMIFGSSIKVLHTERRVLVDDWIDLGVSAKTGVMFREIREHVDRVLKELYAQETNKCSGSTERTVMSQVIDGIVDLLSQG